MKKRIEALHNLFNQIIPFCRAASNPEVQSKIEEAEVLFIRLEESVKQREAEMKTLLGEEDSQ